MRSIILCLLFLPVIVWAEKPAPVATAEADATASASQSQSVSTSTALDNDVGLSNSTRTNMLSLGASPSQVQARDCFVPAKGRGKSHVIGGGLYATSGYLELHDDCWAEYREQREHERMMDLRRLRLEERRIALEEKRLEIQSRQQFAATQEK